MTAKPKTTKPILNVHGEHRAFFGRKIAKDMGPGQRKLFDSLLPALEISLPETGRVDPNALFEVPPDNLIMEIGYGGGEHLARKAAESPATGFIGCEVFTGGIGKLLEKIKCDDLSNIRLFTDDAIKFLKALPDASLDGVYLLYPDPWPKTRHHKRRFVSTVTLYELARTIKPGGFFRFATDIEDYANWTLAHILRSDSFIWSRQTPGAWHHPYPGWQSTRYEKKARREGRLKSYYFTFSHR